MNAPQTLAELALRTALAVAILAGVAFVLAVCGAVARQHGGDQFYGVLIVYVLCETAALLHRCNRALRGMS